MNWLKYMNKPVSPLKDSVSFICFSALHWNSSFALVPGGKNNLLLPCWMRLFPQLNQQKPGRKPYVNWPDGIFRAGALQH